MTSFKYEQFEGLMKDQYAGLSVSSYKLGS